MSSSIAQSIFWDRQALRFLITSKPPTITIRTKYFPIDLVIQELSPLSHGAHGQAMVPLLLYKFTLAHVDTFLSSKCQPIPCLLSSHELVVSTALLRCSRSSSKDDCAKNRSRAKRICPQLCPTTASPGELCPVGPVDKRGHERQNIPHSQFSTFRSATRLNSVRLRVMIWDLVMRALIS